MAGLAWYNSYSPKERLGKLAFMNRMIARGELAPAERPCAICQDPDVAVEPHGEDYVAPQVWGAPAQYCLCRLCRRDRLHKRCSKPTIWQAHLMHIRRGCYARDLKENPTVKAEVELARRALHRGETLTLAFLRPYPLEAGSEWFASVRMDAQALEDVKAWARP